MTVCCLLPGEPTAIDAGPPAPRPLGTVLVVPGGDDNLARVAESVDQWRASPWCPTVLVAAHNVAPRILDLLVPSAMHVTPLCGEVLPPVAEIRNGIRQRRMPDATDIAAYIAFRTSLGLANLYSDLRDSAVDADLLRRSLRRYGAWLPHDWRALGSCLELITRALAAGHTEAMAAELAGVDVKTVSRWCRRYFGLTWRELVAMDAWEAALEAALQAGGYVTDR